MLNEIFDLFSNLDASDEQLDFPVLYGSGRDGWMAVTRRDPRPILCRCSNWSWSMCRLRWSRTAPFRLLATTLEADPYSVACSPGASALAASSPTRPSRPMRRDGSLIEDCPRHQGASLPGPRAYGRRSGRSRRHCRHRRYHAGNRCRHPVRSIGRSGLLAQPIRSADACHDVSINDGPFAGPGGDKVQSRVIRDRLLKEAERNVAIRVPSCRGQGCLRGRRPWRTAARYPDRDHAPGRLRTYRSRARAWCSRPTPTRASAWNLSRKSSSTSIRSTPASWCRSCRSAAPTSGHAPVRWRPAAPGLLRPTRGLIGYQGELLTDTRGTAVMNRLLPRLCTVQGRTRARNGVLVRRCGCGHRLLPLLPAGPRRHDHRPADAGI